MKLVAGIFHGGPLYGYHRRMEDDRRWQLNILNRQTENVQDRYSPSYNDAA